ncbi:MAG TPA: cardiolipin synthase [Candidatus Cryptobacteroides merdipullorum]|uniref:Cardiolipin synthase n=1 Tax=Candidatus Cryptobacteroides merdipullorum TaxID=2840771 RepID=A0A9D1KHB2_9BACT|nr:cardiolipin synthase [Candidatus Cryptobacteroides merdipullorum]
MPRWFYILLALAVFSLVVMVIAENRHPVRTLAWIVVLVCLPGVGLVLYFFFGRDNRGKRLISDEDLTLLKTMTEEQCGGCILREMPEENGDLVNLLWRTNRAYPLGGNAVRVYTDFDSMFGDLLADLEAARDHIHFEFFKIEDDPIGRKIEDVLVRKARAGVEVRLQYDDAANLGWKHFFRRMEQGGVQVQPFIKVEIPFLSSNTNYRNHRKVVVIDGRIGYLGGMNIAERYSIGVHGGPWRDTHMRVEGPAASELQTSFLADWQFSSKELLASRRYYPALEPCGDVTMQVATSGPMDEWRVIMQGIVRMISSSSRYIYIQSPYLIPTDSVFEALRNAALSGVDVRVMIPYRGDKGVTVPLASRSYVKEVVAAGVKVFFWPGGYMHSKAIVSDDRVATIGSTNMDVRSYEQDFEINAFIYDRGVAAEVRDAFLEDQKRCWQVDARKWARRPLHVRFAESLARLLSPLL